MDKIIIKNSRFYAYHGVLNEEKILGQKFYVDLEIYTDLKKPGLTDDVKDTINYKLVYDIVKDCIENNKYNLIEALGENITQKLFEEFTKIKEIVVTIKKPEAPVDGIYDYFGVEIRRVRNE